MTDGEADGEGLGLEYLSRLTFFDTRFEYLGKFYSYRDIQHIQFTATATKKSVNFVPIGTNYDAQLILLFDDGRKLRVAQEYAFRSQSQKDRSEAVMRAASLFLNLTFDQRADAYEKKIKEKGFVSWGRHQIAKDGDLFRNNELRFNILKDDVVCNLGPFHVECRKSDQNLQERLKGLWAGNAEIIDISVDKDCFLYIMKNYLGLAWKSQPAPERRRENSEVFNEALLVLGAKLCKADGRISPEEILQFKQYFGIDDTSHPGASKIFRQAAKTTSDVREVAKTIFSLLHGRTQPLEYILVGLMKIAAADGRIDEAEQDFIRDIAKEFLFSTANIDRLFLMFEMSGDQEYRYNEQSRPSSKSLHFQHLEILGLQENATFDEIRLAYRKLARQHHPDLLRAQGIPIDSIQDSEELLKTINSAYEWLSRYHDARH